MHSDEQIDLTAAEEALLAALPRESVPSDLLEERVVRALRNDGHFGSPRPSRSRGPAIAVRIAAAAALFAGGVATGRVMMPDRVQAASVTSPMETKIVPSASTAIPVKENETVIAVREMWL